MNTPEIENPKLQSILEGGEKEWLENAPWTYGDDDINVWEEEILPRFLIASSATLALKSGEWFFRFVILNRLSHKSIHLNYWSEFLRPPLWLSKAFSPALLFI